MELNTCSDKDMRLIALIIDDHPFLFRSAPCPSDLPIGIYDNMKKGSVSRGLQTYFGVWIKQGMMEEMPVRLWTGCINGRGEMGCLLGKRNKYENSLKRA
jgi:hypothetical protein